MLQQTQVATVVPYYLRFVERFPDVTALAAAPLDAVLHVWTGLGYYARARNLHRAARILVELHDGCVPNDIDSLQALPGIGRSTAGAILALSHGQGHPILDGNARRVLARVFGVEGSPADTATLHRLWDLADACTPSEAVAAYTQAIMDLGAGVCTRSKPRCEACPLQDACVARLTGRQGELPSPRMRRKRPHRSAYALVIRDAAGALLLRQRPAHGVWGGLWSFPQFDGEAEARQWLAGNFPAAGEPTRLPPQRHVFTHYDLDLRLIAAEAGEVASDSAPGAWHHPRHPGVLGISKAVTRFVNISYVK
jgi:A/G-specific adenine glycosylase